MERALRSALEKGDKDLARAIATKWKEQAGGSGDKTETADQDSPGLASVLWNAMGDVASETVGQIPGGFNDRLSQIARGVDVLLGGGGETYLSERPEGDESLTRRLADMINSGNVPKPKTAAGRAFRAGGEFLPDVLLPAAGMQVAAGRAGGAALGDRVRDVTLAPFRAAPASTLAAETIAGTGAGMGGQVGEEVGGTTGRAIGELAGGVAPSMLPSALGVRLASNVAGRARSSFSREQQTARAKEYLSEQLGGAMTPEAQASMGRARAIQRDAPGFKPTVAEAAGEEVLLRWQSAIQKRMGTADAAQEGKRISGSRQALRESFQSRGPKGEGGPEEAVAPLIQERQQAAGQAREVRSQQLAVREQRKALPKASAIADAERQALEELKGRTSQQYTDLAGDVAVPIDRTERGRAIRERLVAKRDNAAAYMAGRANDLGINSADVTVNYDRFGNSVKEWTEGMLPSNRQNMPGAMADVRELQARAQARLDAQSAGADEIPPPITFQDVKALRESVVDDLLDSMRDTSPGARKRRGNALRLRKMIDDQLLGDDAFVDTDPGLADRYRIFRSEYFDEVIKPYERGAAFEARRNDQTGFYRTLDEEIASDFLGSQDAARQYNELFGDDPDALRDLAAVVFDDLAARAIRNGVIRPAAVESWWSAKRRILQEIPAIGKKAEGLVRAVREIGNQNTSDARLIRTRTRDARQQLERRRAALDAREAQLHEQTKPLLERSGQLSERLMAIDDVALVSAVRSIQRGNKTPAALIDDAMANPKQMAALRDRLQGKPKAMAALKRHVWDGLGSFDDGKKLNAYIDQNNKALGQLFSQNQLNAARQLADGLEMMARLPAPSGKPADFDPINVMRDITGADPSALMARFLAVQRGRSSRFVESFAGMMNFLRRRAAIDTENLVRTALYDLDGLEAFVDYAAMRTPRHSLADHLSKAGAKSVRPWVAAVGFSLPFEGEQ